MGLGPFHGATPRRGAPTALVGVGPWDDDDERDWRKKPAHHFRPMRRKKYAWQAAPKKKIFVDGKVTIGTESDDESTSSTGDDDGAENYGPRRGAQQRFGGYPYPGQLLGRKETREGISNRCVLG